jgi:predicted alpha/beta-hydrolase family hydrolase
LEVTVESHGATTARVYRSTDADAPCLVLAHGAGAGQQHPFMVSTARALGERGVDVVTFDFLYMAAGRRSPDRAPVLEATWRAALAEIRRHGVPRSTHVAIGGKSMGGRMASHVMASDAPPPGVEGLLLLGYPLHPPGQPQKLRTAHLPALRTPTLVVQGSRDEFGGDEEVRAAFAVVPGPVAWHVVAGGDHSFKVRRNAGRSQAEVLGEVYDAVAAWVHRVSRV